ncbi:MAG: flippase-like domain-containing protein [Halobacteriota archaeon]|nr:flippase-like domain-containing protein [Halobacteriota archaeon]
MKGVRKWLILSLTVSVIAIIVVLSVTMTEETVDSLAKIRPEYLLLAVVARAMCWVAMGSRIKILSRVVGCKISLLQSIKIVLPGTFAAGVTPSYIGGEPVRIYLLSKKGLSIGDAAAVDLGGMILNGLVVAMMLPFAWFIFRDTIRPNFVLSSVFLFVGILFGLAWGFGIYGMLYPEQLKKLLDRLGRSKLISEITFGRSEQIISRVVIEFDNFRNGLLRFVREGRRELILGLLWTMAYWFFLIILPSIILLGMNLDPMWVPSMAAQVILMTIVMIPIAPGGSGIAEIGAASLYSVVLPADGIQLLGVFVAIWRFVEHYIPLLIGGLVSLKVMREIDLNKLIEG